MARYGSKARYRLARDMSKEAAQLSTSVKQAQREEEQATAYSSYGRTAGSIIGGVLGLAGGPVGAALGAGVGSYLGSLGGAAVAERGDTANIVGGKFHQKTRQEARKDIGMQEESREKGYKFSAASDAASAFMLAGGGKAFKTGTAAAPEGASLWQTFKGGVTGVKEARPGLKDIIKSKIPGGKELSEESLFGGDKFVDYMDKKEMTALAKGGKERLIEATSAQREALKAAHGGRIGTPTKFTAPSMTSTTTSTKDVSGNIAQINLEDYPEVRDLQGWQQGPYGPPLSTEDLAGYQESRTMASQIPGEALTGDMDWWKKGDDVEASTYGRFAPRSQPQLQSKFSIEGRKSGMVPGGFLSDQLGYRAPDDETLYSRVRGGY